MHGGDARGAEPSAVRPGLAQARRRVRRSRIAIIAAVLTVIVPVGVVLGLRSSGQLVDGSEPAPAVHALGLALAVVGLVMCVVGAVRARRAKALRPVWSSPTVALDPADSKRLLMRIRADDVVPRADHEHAVALAEQLARQRFLFPSYVGGMVLLVGSSLLTSVPVIRWLVAIALVSFAVGLPLVVRDTRRARTWLAHHAATDV